MGVPASAIRKLIGRSAKTALSEGMLAKEAAQFPGPLKSAMLRQAALSPKTERGYNQLNRLGAFLEGLYNKSLYKDTAAMASPKTASRIGDESRQIEKLLKVLGSTEAGTDEMWRKLMSS